MKRIDLVVIFIIGEFRVRGGDSVDPRLDFVVGFSADAVLFPNSPHKPDKARKLGLKLQSVFQRVSDIIGHFALNTLPPAEREKFTMR